MIQSFYQHPFNIFLGFEQGIAGGKGMNTFHTRVTGNRLHELFIFSNRDLFGNDGFPGLFFLYTDMTPETEDLLADRFLEPIGEGQGHNHDHYTNDRGGHG